MIRPPSRPYDAFISYSHAADGRLAPALQAGLHRFAKPWYRLRALRVFRDATNLEVSPGLWDSIVAALGGSKRFLLLASPRAAASKWVQREVDYWLSQREPARLLILLTDGELLWSETAGDFDWERSNALPPGLAGRFSQEPLFLDLRWARKAEDLSLRNPRFLDAVAQIAAPMHGRSKDELVGDDVLQHQRTQRWVRGGVASLAVLAAVSTAAAVIAVQQRRLADTERERADDQRRQAEAQRQLAEDRLRQAESRRLAAQAVRLLNQDDALLMRAGLLAVESLKLEMNDDGAEAVRAVLARAALPLAEYGWTQEQPQPTDARLQVAWSDGNRFRRTAEWAAEVRWDGGAPLHVKPGVQWADPPDCGPNKPEWMAIDVTLGDRAARVTDRRSGRTLRLVHDGAITGCAVSADGQRVITVSSAVPSEMGDPIPGDGTLRVWDIRPQLEGLGQLRPGHQQLQVSAFSPDGLLAAAADDGSDVVRLFDVASGAQVAALPVDEGLTIVELRFSPDSKRLAALPIYSDHAYVWAVAPGSPARLLRRLQQPTSEGGLAFSADGRVLAVDFGGMNARGDATYWDLETGAKLPALRSPDDALGTSVAFAPDGLRLVKRRADESVEFWDVAQQRKTGEFVEPGASIGLINDDATRLVLTYPDNQMAIWSVDPAQELMVVEGPAGAMEARAFSPDGRFLVTSDEDFDWSTQQPFGTACVWDLSDGSLRQSFVYGETIGGIGFTPDGRWLAVSTYAYGGTLLNALRVSNVMDVYDTTTWARVTRLNHQGLVAEADFSPDGRYLAANVHLSEESGGAPAFMWLWRREDLIAAACARLTRPMTAAEWAEYMPDRPYRVTCAP